MKLKTFLILLILSLSFDHLAAGQNLYPKNNRQTYTVGGGASFTVLDSLVNLESEADRGFWITKVCIYPGSATAAVHTTWQLIRTTTASSGGTLITTEATSGVSFLAKGMYNVNNWTGIARVGGTEGTSGAILDGGGIFVGTATTANGGELCRTYCLDDKQFCPFIPKGVTNGVKLMFTGTAGGTVQGCRIEFAAE